jgi:threonylcarbamoyladenosine tRNA methylthiotransferase MtaB
MAAKIPDAAIGADILVGFPGETERAFQHTVDWVDALPFTYLHVFPFSPRKKTAASHLAGRLPAEVMRLRSQTIRDLAMAKKTAFAKQLTGKTVQIIAEKSQGHDLVQAVSDNYMPVLVTGPLAPKALGWARIVSPTIPLGGALTSHPPDCPVRRP